MFRRYVDERESMQSGSGIRKWGSLRKQRKMGRWKSVCRQGGAEEEEDRQRELTVPEATMSVAAAFGLTKTQRSEPKSLTLAHAHAHSPFSKTGHSGTPQACQRSETERKGLECREGESQPCPAGRLRERSICRTLTIVGIIP
eukprot:1573299-Rhodomonas_salina.1